MDTITVDCSASIPPPEEDLRKMRLQVLRAFEDGKISSDTLMNSLETIKEQEESTSLAEPQVRQMTPEEVAQHEKDQVEGRRVALMQRRAQRNSLLREVDWTQIPDAPLTEAKKQTFRDYRQALRDLDLTQEEISWPDPPA
jgi:hypothetical protein